MNHDRHGHSFVVSAAKGHMGSWKLEYPTPTKTPHRNVTFRIPPVLWQKNNEKEGGGLFWSGERVGGASVFGPQLPGVAGSSRGTTGNIAGFVGGGNASSRLRRSR